MAYYSPNIAYEVQIRESGHPTEKKNVLGIQPAHLDNIEGVLFFHISLICMAKLQNLEKIRTL